MRTAFFLLSIMISGGCVTQREWCQSYFSEVEPKADPYIRKDCEEPANYFTACRFQHFVRGEKFSVCAAREGGLEVKCAKAHENEGESARKRCIWEANHPIERECEDAILGTYDESLRVLEQEIERQTVQGYQLPKNFDLKDYVFTERHRAAAEQREYWSCVSAYYQRQKMELMRARQEREDRVREYEAIGNGLQQMGNDMRMYQLENEMRRTKCQQGNSQPGIHVNMPCP